MSRRKFSFHSASIASLALDRRAERLPSALPADQPGTPSSEKSVTAIEVEEDKLKITRHNDFITLGGKFPRLTKKEAKARLKEIKRLLLAI